MMKNEDLYHTEKDFPINAEELGYEWESGGTNGFQIGDRVVFKYTLNLDPYDVKEIKQIRECQDEIGTIIGFDDFKLFKYEYLDENYPKCVLVKFDNKRLNNREIIQFNFIPMQFEKIN